MLEAFGLSDPGCIRAKNEDYFISDCEAGIFILADGMGGANAGEYASRLSAEKIYNFLLDPSRQNGVRTLEQAFLETNAVVRETAKGDPKLDGMGTTLVVARKVNGTHFQIGSVGDSRAYLLSERRLSLVTKDQTWVAEVGAQLGLTDEAIKKHPMRHMLTMAVGTTDELRISFCVIELGKGDQLLLCSDGLHGVVQEENLMAALSSEKTLPEKCHYLIDAARAAGGPDNVTVILIQSV
ncbi:MAG: serine/threonine-protein phosphatase [Acidobacteriaceae bacterium]|nr:serine/threonine-protein phosphatase [Acidobacteriaceae bacterium]MBV8571126.1 serine/threonine-protein phosphatase [Acidobacteriaceae bacterium]